MMNELEKKLEEKKKELQKKGGTKTWKPNPGDVLEGRVADMGKTITQYGEAEYIEIETKDNERYLIFINKVLKERLTEEKVEVGDKIAIRFEGLVPGKRRRDYRSLKRKSKNVRQDRGELHSPLNPPQLPENKGLFEGHYLGKRGAKNDPQKHH